MELNKEVDLGSLKLEDEKFIKDADVLIEKASGELEQNSEISKLIEQIKKEGVVEVGGKTYKAFDTGNGLKMTEIILKKGEIKPEWGETKVLDYVDLEKQKIEVGSGKELEGNINEYKTTQEAAIQSKEERLTKLLTEKAMLETSREEMNSQGDLDKIDVDETTRKEIEETLRVNNEKVKEAELDLKKAEQDLKFIIEFKGNNAS